MKVKSYLAAKVAYKQSVIDQINTSQNRDRRIYTLGPKKSSINNRTSTGDRENSGHPLIAVINGKTIEGYHYEKDNWNTLAKDQKAKVAEMIKKYHNTNDTGNKHKLSSVNSHFEEFSQRK